LRTNQTYALLMFCVVLSIGHLIAGLYHNYLLYGINRDYDLISRFILKLYVVWIVVVATLGGKQ